MVEEKIVFKTKVVQNSSSKKVKSFVGKHIRFDLTPVTKGKKAQTTKMLHGMTINFTLHEKGRWLWSEKKPQVCMICKLPIKEHHKVLRCPMCQSIFHDDHIFEWLKVKGKCPVCMQNLQSWQLEERKKEN